jgi:hypothetical protein
MSLSIRVSSLITLVDCITQTEEPEIGKEIGALQKSRDAIKTVLTVRFGQISSEIEEIIGKMTNPTILEELLKLAATANSLAEFKQSLAKINI